MNLNKHRGKNDLSWISKVHLGGPASDVNKDWTCKDKDKDQAYKDQDKDKD